MATALLTTKLYIPTVRRNMVPRPRLIERLNAGLYGKLTLISAPAGFGKTTLVTTWVDALRSDPPKENHYKIAWVSLDEGDNDPARFLSYIIAALIQDKAIDPTFGNGLLSMLQSPQPPPSDGLLTSLINEMSNSPDRILLILDDYYLIEAQPIHETLTFLLEHQPPQAHLVIATREDPHLPLARLRARGQLSELRALDLRFSSSEAADFLNQTMGLDLSTEDIATLETRTEGWIAGLQLAGISMQRHKDISKFIKSFTGSHRLVLDYLIEEVLSQQPQHIQDFLLQTAVLDRLCGPLSDAVRFGSTETSAYQSNGQAILEMLDRADLFIVPLDEERHWYRYHHLFADVLYSRLKEHKSFQVARLYLRASAWYQQNGFIDEAIEYALRAEDYEQAAFLIKNHADTVWASGEHYKMWRWLESLPAKVVTSRPELTILRAAHFFITGQQEAAKPLLRTAEKVLTLGTDRGTETPTTKRVQLSEGERMSLLGRISAIRALIASYQGDAQRIIRHARRALDMLPTDDMWRSPAAITQADAQSYLGEMEAAHQAHLEAIEICERTGNTFLILYSHANLVITLKQQGRLKQALEICQQQMQLAAEKGMGHTGVVGWLLSIWGETLAEVNDLDGALDRAKRGVDLTEQAGDIMMLGRSYPCLIRVLYSRGDLSGAEQVLLKMERLGSGLQAPSWIRNSMSAWRARIWLAQGKLGNVSQWARESGLVVDGDITYPYEMGYIVLARFLIVQEQLDEASKLLLRLLTAAERGGRITRAIEIMILQAIVLQAKGQLDQSIAALERALRIAETGGYIRIFVDEGPSVARLLYEAVSRGISPEYVQILLAAFPVEEPEKVAPPQTQLPEYQLIETLSDRELEVLQLLAKGLTNQEIAARLYLSKHTVKVHARNIYGKLGVSNRAQAGARARSLGILSPE